MYKLGGIPVYQNSNLPCSKINALCLPKNNKAKREFWIDTNDQVWGYSEILGFDSKIYLCEKAFGKLKNGKLKETIN